MCASVEQLSERAERADTLASEVTSLRRQLARSERAANRIRQRQQQQQQHQRQQQQQQKQQQEGQQQQDAREAEMEGIPHWSEVAAVGLQRNGPPPAKRARIPQVISNPFGVSALAPHTRTVASAGHASSFATDTLRQRNGVRNRPTPVRTASSNGSFVKHGYNALGERHRVVVGHDGEAQKPCVVERPRSAVPRAQRVVLRGGLSVQRLTNVFGPKASKG